MTSRPDRDPVFRREPARAYPQARRAEGARIFADDGRSWLDGAGNVFVTTVGHGVREVEDALVAQLRQLLRHESP